VDAADFLAGFRDPKVHQNTYGGRLAPTAEAVEAYLARVAARREAGEALTLAAIDRDTGAFLGTTMLFRFDVQGLAEVGFWFAQHARRRGLTEAAIALTMRWGFEQLGLTRIEGLTSSANTHSQKAMLRAGMRRDGERGDFVVFTAQPSDED
jgi:RimJ/RimL family protein N-acetyltransferase